MMKTTTINCPECGQRLGLPAEKQGKVLCPKCTASFEASTLTHPIIAETEINWRVLLKHWRTAKIALMWITNLGLIFLIVLQSIGSIVALGWLLLAGAWKWILGALLLTTVGALLCGYGARFLRQSSAFVFIAWTLVTLFLFNLLPLQDFPHFDPFGTTIAKTSVGSTVPILIIWFSVAAVPCTLLFKRHIDAGDEFAMRFSFFHQASCIVAAFAVWIDANSLWSVFMFLSMALLGTSISAADKGRLYP